MSNRRTHLPTKPGSFPPGVGRTRATRRPLRYDLGEWGASVKDCLPAGVKRFCLDLLFGRMPIWFSRAIWKELDGYLKLRTPGHGDIVVDAGAWTGHFTIVAARLVGPGGRVIAIEPQGVMCERLRNRLDRLGLRNVTVVQSGLFDRASEIAAPRKNSSSFSVLEHATDATSGETVSLRTLDEILRALGVGKLAFIKMDIEGAELEALAGMRDTLRSMHPFLAIASYHLRDGARTSHRVEKILASAGYSAKTGHPAHLTTWAWCQADELR